MTQISDHGAQPFITPIEKNTLENTNFRTTLWTGKNIQVTLMTIQPGHDIGLEVHHDIDQFLRIEEGSATVYFGESEDTLVAQSAVQDDAILVPGGTWHNLVNTGDIPLKLYSIYGPPDHAFGTVHITKHDAEVDENE